jgi:hypothetical protein
MDPAIDVYLGSPIDIESEQLFLTTLVSDLRSRGHDAIILGNFHTDIRLRQIDFFVVVARCVCHIELKNWTASVFGSRNGHWMIQEPNGNRRRLGPGNPYDQAHQCLYAISDDLRAARRDDRSLPPAPGNGQFYRAMESVICVFPRLEPGSSVVSDFKVQVMGYPELIPFLESTDRNPGWQKEHWVRFAMRLGLVHQQDPSGIERTDVAEARRAVEAYEKRFRDYYTVMWRTGRRMGTWTRDRDQPTRRPTPWPNSSKGGARPPIPRS